MCVGLSPSSPLGRKPPLAQSSMGLIWSSGLSELQGEKDFSARILAICGGQEELSWVKVAWLNFRFSKLFLLPPTPPGSYCCCRRKLQ